MSLKIGFVFSITEKQFKKKVLYQIKQVFYKIQV
jgi:hypothetical protein